MGTTAAHALLPGDRPSLGDENRPPIPVALQKQFHATACTMKGAVVTALAMTGSVSAFFAPVAKTLGSTQVGGDEAPRGIRNAA